MTALHQETATGDDGGQCQLQARQTETVTDGVTRRGFLAGSCALAAGATVPGVASGGLSKPGSDATGSAESVPDDIEARVEELVIESLEEHDIPGASVAVVRDGTTTLVEGYGVADRETDRSVEADTPFRLGSVSKPVVSTAIARLVQQGDLDPHRPVREYIDDDLVSWDEPVTLAQLATHTAGFESTNRHMWYDDPGEVRALPEHLDSMPAQVRRPGKVGAYSNHGVALAGQVLAAVHGSSFPDAMDELLLSPAGMETATFQQPLPADLQDAHARGHSGEVDGKFAGLGIAPAGALSASAADVGQYMELCLDGAVDGEQVLDPETVELVQRQWFTHHDELAGMAFGFVEDERGDTRILRHAGGTPQDVFYSELRLVPELGFGLYISYNDDAPETLFEVADEVFEEVIPTEEADVSAPGDTPYRADDLEGTYRALRHGVEAHDSFFTTLNAGTAEAEVADDGALRIEVDSETTRWVETEPLVFRNEETGELLAFGDLDGELYLYRNGDPTAMKRISWYEDADLHMLAFLVSLVGVASGWFLWGPDRDESETRREWLRSLRSNRPRQVKFAANGSSTLFSLFIIAFFWFMSLDWAGMFTEPRLAFRALFALSILGALGAVVATALTARVWREGYWQRRVRVHYTFVAASLVAMTVFLWRWNLLFPP